MARFAHPRYRDSNLSAAEIAEVVETSRYLRQHAETEFKHMPEKSVNAVLNGTSPRVRQFLKDSKEIADFTADGGRTMPFQQQGGDRPRHHWTNVILR